MELTSIPDQVHPALIETVDEETGMADGQIRIECQFNPTELTIKKSARWKAPDNPPPARNAPDLDFGGGDPATFDLSLLFDTTRETSSSDRDVRQYTNALLALTMLRKKSGKVLEPPLVRFSWGGFALFMAVVTEVEIKYTLFHGDGMPVRARAEVSFTQQDDTDDARLHGEAQNPTTRTESRKTHVVRAGERLDLIAYQEYGHPAHWRFLAEANDLQDPRLLEPGQILAIPAL
jgi:nucleoid-associated protein YgaU